MRILIFKFTLLVVAVILAIAITVYLFRTDYPFLWLGSVFVWFAIFLFFPYNKYFKTKK